MVFPYDEYVAIESEYNDDADLMLIVKSVISTSNHLKVTWLEGNTDDVYVDLDGWYVCHSADRYPTFEAMSMSHSSMFKERWPLVIFNKLKRVEEDEAKDRGEV